MSLTLNRYWKYLIKAFLLLFLLSCCFYYKSLIPSLEDDSTQKMLKLSFYWQSQHKIIMNWQHSSLFSQSLQQASLFSFGHYLSVVSMVGVSTSFASASHTRANTTYDKKSNKKALIRYANICSRSSSLITEPNQQAIINFFMHLF